MLKSLALIAALAIAAPALAEGGEPSCGSEGAPPCPKPTEPDMKNIVVGGFNYGSFNFGTARSGYMSTMTNGGPPVAVPPYWAYHDEQIPYQLGSSTVSLGTATSAVDFTLNATGPSELYSVAVGAKNLADGAAGVGLTLSYYIKLEAADATEAAKIDAILAAGARARAQGKFMLDLQDEGQADVSAATGQFTFGQTDRMAAHCWNTGGYVDTTGCGTHDYELSVDFTRGDTFEGGSALVYYGDVTISAFTYGSGSNFTGSAFIDPVIVFGSGFKNINFTAQGGDTPLALAFVPEPAQWALMIGGFGFVGGAMRRRRGVALA